MSRLEDHVSVCVEELCACAPIVFSARSVGWGEVRKTMPLSIQAEAFALGFGEPCRDVQAEMVVRGLQFDTLGCSEVDVAVKGIARVGASEHGIVFAGTVCMHPLEEYVEYPSPGKMSVELEELDLPQISDGVSIRCVVCDAITTLDENGLDKAHECGLFWARCSAQFGHALADETMVEGSGWNMLAGSHGKDVEMQDVALGDDRDKDEFETFMGEKLVLVRVEDHVLDMCVFVSVVTPRSLLLAMFAIADVVVRVIVPDKRGVVFPSPFTPQLMGGDYAVSGLRVDMFALSRVAEHYRLLFDRSTRFADRSVNFLIAFGEAVACSGGIMGNACPVRLEYDRVSMDEYLADVDPLYTPPGVTVARFVNGLRRSALLAAEPLPRDPGWRGMLSMLLCQRYGRLEQGLTPHIRTALQNLSSVVGSRAFGGAGVPSQMRMTDFVSGGLGMLLKHARDNPGLERAFIELLAVVRRRFACAQTRFFLQKMRIPKEHLFVARSDERFKYDIDFLVYLLGLNWECESRSLITSTPAHMAVVPVSCQDM